MSDDAAALGAVMAMLARRKWAGLTAAEKAAHIRLMVAGRRKARLHRRAKAKGGK